MMTSPDELDRTIDGLKKLLRVAWRDLQTRCSPHSSAVKRAIRSDSTALNCGAISRRWKRGSGASETNPWRNRAVALANQNSGSSLVACRAV